MSCSSSRRAVVTSRFLSAVLNFPKRQGGRLVVAAALLCLPVALFLKAGLALSFMSLAKIVLEHSPLL